ncbi:MAG TPA: hypothetical protein VGQ68_10000, partial [Gaiellaceae bacterium]|nr:hypothetical protein [Gaiellaceae bacterium]
MPDTAPLGGINDCGDDESCSRCGGPIGDEDSLIVYDADEREFDRMLAAGRNPLDDPPPVLAHYCELCMAQIDEHHEAHDEAVEAF